MDEHTAMVEVLGCRHRAEPPVPAIRIPCEDRPCPALVHVGPYEGGFEVLHSLRARGHARYQHLRLGGPNTEIPELAIQQRNGNRDGQMHFTHVAPAFHGLA